MASIERTAYPRFKCSPPVRELEALKTPTDDEMHFGDHIIDAEAVAEPIDPSLPI